MRDAWMRPVHLKATAPLALIVAVFLMLLVPAGPAAADTCVADGENGCITGTIRSSKAEPLADILVVVSGDDTTLETRTEADGRWSVKVPPGEYTVALETATLPAGEALRDPAQNPRTVVVRVGASSGALFPLGTPAAVSSPGSTSPADGEQVVTTTPRQGVSWGRVAQQAVSGLIFGLLLALASVGLSLIYGTTGLSNFAHGEQVTLGGILAYTFAQLVGWPLLPAAIIAVVLSALSGYLQDWGIWHQLRKRGVGTTQQMIVTIGLSMVMQYTFQFFFGGGALRIVKSNPQTVNLGPVIITHQSLVSVGVAIVALIAVAYFLLATRTGRATRAVSDNPSLAAASGIATEQIVRLVWTLGAGLAGLGGVLMALYLNATDWNLGGSLLLLMFAAVTLGGLGAAFGALAGSMVIGLVVEMSNLVIPTDMRYAGALLILILVLLFRPQGLLGRAERVG